MTNTQIEKRLIILEEVVHDMGLIIATHLPEVRHQLSSLGSRWERDTDKIEKEVDDEQSLV